MTKQYTVDPSKMLHLMREIEKDGGEIIDHHFKVKELEGDFELLGENMIVTVPRKRFLSTWLSIEQKLDYYFK